MPPSKRELFLQNRLAMASVLLYKCTRFLLKFKTTAADSLLIECEEYFNETKEQIATFTNDPLPESKPEPTLWKRPVTLAERIRLSLYKDFK